MRRGYAGRGVWAALGVLVLLPCAVALAEDGKPGTAGGAGKPAATADQLEKDLGALDDVLKAYEGDKQLSDPDYRAGAAKTVRDLIAKRQADLEALQRELEQALSGLAKDDKARAFQLRAKAKRLKELLDRLKVLLERADALFPPEGDQEGGTAEKPEARRDVEIDPEFARKVRDAVRRVHRRWPVGDAIGGWVKRVIGWIEDEVEGWAPKKSEGGSFRRPVDDAPVESALVLPSGIEAREAFTFSAGTADVAEGEVVDIATVEGEVVASRPADRRGRVFLAAGLATGTYLVSTSSGGRTRAIGRILVERTPPPTLQRGDAIRLESPPAALRQGQAVRLTGSGLAGDARRLRVTDGQGRPLEVLASTERELVAEPPSGLGTGFRDLRVENAETGAKLDLERVLIYDLRAQLQRRTIHPSGTTMLEVHFDPKGVEVQVRSQVVSGPVRFGNGQKQMVQPTRGGVARFPLVAEPGQAGPFSLAWSVVGVGEDPR